MWIFYDALESLRTMSLFGVAWWVLVENILIFVLALIIGELLLRLYHDKLVAEPAPPLTREEVMLAISCVLLNALVTFVGALLWRADIITIHYREGFGVIVDVLVLFFVMDFAMYVLHRVAHHPILYPFIHQTHHKYENPRPLTLFVLNPFEVLGFGVLWLIVVSLYDSSFLGIAIYLILNVAFGLCGHLGVEPLPKIYLRIPVLRYISTSTFHAEHHGDKHHNFGFYTLICDKLFGTLSPDYERDFDRANSTLTL